MKPRFLSNRRDFIRTSLLGTLAVSSAPAAWAVIRTGTAAPGNASPARVALMAGDDRANNIFRGLKAFEKEIKLAIGTRRVVIKPNLVSTDKQLAATHAGAVEATLEFLKSIGKLGDVVIAESAAGGPAMEGYSNFGYTRLAEKYHVKLLDLDQEPVEEVQVFDERDVRPHAVRVSSVLLDPNSFIVSAAKMKTHDRVVTTLSLKNIILGSVVKDPGFRWGAGSKPGTRTDKPIAHGGGYRGINYNLFALAQRLHPHLSVIDGFDGLEGNGPVGGTAVDHRVGVVGLDWLAADRVCVELMGIDFAKVGYLNYCARAGLGEADLARIEVLGDRIAGHIKPYKLHDEIEKQLVWMNPERAATKPW
jgi:uncharacterized protein (DUF362 family)